MNQDEQLVPAWERYTAKNQSAPEPVSPWVIRFPVRRNPRLRLFCFHYAGSGASIFRSWETDAPVWMEVCAVQLPGREGRLREAPFRDMRRLAPQLVDALSGLVDRPYACYGHSLGALCAFEVVHGLRRLGKPMPRHFFAAAHRAPHLQREGPLAHCMDDDALLAELSRLGGTPEAVLAHPELMELLMPVVRADLALTEAYDYQPQPPLDCPITVLAGSHDVEVTLHQLDAWHRHTRGGFERRILEGDHFFIHGAQRELIAAILDGLGKP